LPGIPTEQIFAFLAQRIAEAGAASGLHFWPAGQRDWDGKKLFGPEFRRAFSAAMQVVPAFEAFKELLASVIDAIAPKRLLLMLDEFDRIQDGIDSGVTSSQVPQNIRFMLQNYPGVTAILTGSRRMTQMRSDYWSVLFGLGHRISVSSIDKNDAARLVTEPVKGRLIFPPQVVDRITEICAYQPFLIQRLCGQVFDLCASEASSVATVDILETAASILVDGMEHFEAFWGFAGSERARFILCVIHRLTRAVEAPPVTLPRIEDELARSGVAIRRDELVGDELKKLIELELVAMERDGYYRLAVPLLSIWISRNKDYEDQRERAARESGSG
jgi:type I restriction enzyme M protein